MFHLAFALPNAPRLMFRTAFVLSNAPWPAFRTAFTLPNAPRPTFRTAFALSNAPRPRLQAQEYSINYNYKSNSQEYIQSIINIYKLHTYCYQRPRASLSVSRRCWYWGFVPTQTLGHGRRLWRVQSGPIWSCKGRRRGLRVGHPCMGLFSFFLFSPLQENKFQFSISYHLWSFYTTGE